MKLCAAIVETRPIPGLTSIIKQHMALLPEGTDLFIFCSYKNDYLLSVFNEANHILLKDDIFTMEDYNKLLSSPEFWAILTLWDKILIFQHDSMILRKGIEEFYQWDYIGASWTWTDKYAGNGGLSLRNPIVMRDICKSFRKPNGLNEDHFIVDTMYREHIPNLAPIEVADKFSCEAKFILGTWGYHGIDSCLSKEQCKQIREQYNG